MKIKEVDWDSDEDLEWDDHDSYFVGKHKKFTLNETDKVAGFDLDHTLIRPKNHSKTFCVTDRDWVFFDGSVRNKLRELSKDHKLVIVTNQKGITKGKCTKEVFKARIENISQRLAVPFLILVSIDDDLYRKPLPILWNLYVKCDKSQSFYCGDAGGIEKMRQLGKEKIPKDFSDTDRKFALNLGIRFMHRDEFIWGKVWSDKKLTLRYPINFNKLPMDKKDKVAFVPSEKQEMIINIGAPGSGKSEFTRNNILIHNQYVWINRDTAGTVQKCIKMCQEALSKGKSVVIDNTNPRLESRKEFIEIAKEFSILVRCLLFDTSLDYAMHNNMYRHVKMNGTVECVPKIAYNVYKKHYKEPTKEEGFDEIINIPFVLNDDTDMALYCLFYY